MTTLQWTWEGGPEGTYTIRVQTLLDGDERAGNNPKEKVIDIAESGYNIALAMQIKQKMCSLENLYSLTSLQQILVKIVDTMILLLSLMKKMIGDVCL